MHYSVHLSTDCRSLRQILRANGGAFPGARDDQRNNLEAFLAVATALGNLTHHRHSDE